MEKIVEKLIIICALFGFKPLEEREKSNNFVWRYKYVESSKIARNCILAMARAFGSDYTFATQYAGSKGVMGKWGKSFCFTKKDDSGSWPIRWTIDVFHKDCCIASFVLYIR